MNAQIIKETMAQTLAGTITFAQVVATLAKEGIESYHVDLVRGETRYYRADGEGLVEKINWPHKSAAQEFSAAKVESAIRQSQAGKIKYKEFIDQVLDAGCVYYIAYLDGRRVAYLGRKGDAHVEHFPK